MQSLRSAVTCTISRDYAPSCRYIYGIIDFVMENLCPMRESPRFARLRVRESRASATVSLSILGRFYFLAEVKKKKGKKTPKVSDCAPFSGLTRKFPASQSVRLRCFLNPIFSSSDLHARARVNFHIAARKNYRKIPPRGGGKNNSRRTGSQAPK